MNNPLSIIIEYPVDGTRYLNCIASKSDHPEVWPLEKELAARVEHDATPAVWFDDDIKIKSPGAFLKDGGIIIFDPRVVIVSRYKIRFRDATHEDECYERWLCIPERADYVGTVHSWAADWFSFNHNWTAWAMNKLRKVLRGCSENERYSDTHRYDVKSSGRPDSEKVTNNFQPSEKLNYYKYIRSKEWKNKSKKAKEKAGWKCQVCNRPASSTTLDTHHRTYERLGNERPEDLTVLCRKCHKLFENSGGLKQYK